MKLCRYCQAFDESSVRVTETKMVGNNQVSFIKRLCQEEKLFVLDKDEACESFYPATYFWCDRENTRMNLEVCLHAQRKGNKGCVKCRQGNHIIEVFRGYRRNSKPPVLNLNIKPKVEVGGDDGSTSKLQLRG